MVIEDTKNRWTKRLYSIAITDFGFRLGKCSLFIWWIR